MGRTRTESYIPTFADLQKMGAGVNWQRAVDPLTQKPKNYQVGLVNLPVGGSNFVGRLYDSGVFVPGPVSFTRRVKSNIVEVDADLRRKMSPPHQVAPSVAKASALIQHISSVSKSARVRGKERDR